MVFKSLIKNTKSNKQQQKLNQKTASRKLHHEYTLSRIYTELDWNTNRNQSPFNM